MPAVEQSPAMEPQQASLGQNLQNLNFSLVCRGANQKNTEISLSEPQNKSLLKSLN
jgi:hypothetical protein